MEKALGMAAMVGSGAPAAKGAGNGCSVPWAELVKTGVPGKSCVPSAPLE